MGFINLNLWAKQGTIKFPDEAEVPFWGFATTAGGEPQFPGPEIRARVGDEIIITLNNNLSEFVSLVFPGQESIPSPVKDNGIFVSYNTHAAPGGSVNYTFTATRPGVFLYESGTSPEKQVTMGLYGAIVIHPKGIDNPVHPDYKTAYGSNTGTYFDVEKVLILGEVDSRFNAQIGAGNQFNMLGFEPDHWVINGRSFPHTVLPDQSDFLVNQPVSSKINAATGQKVLLRCVNAGSQNHTFRLEGITARVAAVDSWPLKPRQGSIDATYLKNTITIASGETYDLIFTAEAEGQYYLHDRDLHHLYNVTQFPGGMATRLDVTPPEPVELPEAPSDLTCRASWRPLAVHLNWKDRSTNELGFVLERKTGTEHFQTIAVLSTPNLTNYTDYNVYPLMTYTYRIRAYNSAGFSGYSNRCSAIPCPIPPFYNPWMARSN
ncbi:multicopper oxidase domain-containing protein [Desulfoscipio geothermicus]|nr:multicopper oxidase domain-containing protein [Desulfoscipio geothermicus]